MKKLVWCFFAICLAGIILVFALNILFPLVYKIKEPLFISPVNVDREIRAIEDLPIRHDPYGDGEFGAKRRNKRYHKGLDLAANMGSPVYASKSGWARTYCIPSGYGNLVIINHPGGWQTRYGHLDKCAIKRFQWVGQGDIIGRVGKTGNADYKGIVPHLHFEIRYRGKPLDPAEFLVGNR